MRQRAVKSAWEIERIRAAAAVADEVSRLIPGLLEEGLTEVEFAGRVEAEARRLGHEGFIRMRGFNQEMFYGQLLTGVSGCVPSYLDTPLAGTGLSPSVAQGASFRRIGRGEPVVFDFVPVRDGYMADFTRMYSLGPLDAELLRAYDAALRVQEAATGAARPGATCRAVWEAALAAADEAGLAGNFMGHGAGQVPYVGHGIGIELDELPVLTGSSLELEPGMVFALEPKFVLPGARRHRHREHLGRHRRRGRAAHAGAGGDHRRRLRRRRPRIDRLERGCWGRVSLPDPERTTRGETMKQLAPDVWTHVDRRRGVPDALGRRPDAAPRHRRRHAHRAPPRSPPWPSSSPPRPADRRVVVVNTHHHWDHVFGNAAFGDVDIVAQRGCPRLIQAELQGGDESLRLPPAEGVPLPNITFGDRLSYTDDGELGAPHPHAGPQRGLAGRLPHREPAAAGRRHGRVAAAQLLPAGRRARSGCRTLRQLKQLPVDLIVPAHGPAMDKQIIDANERYVAGVYEAVAAAKASGAGRGELDLPAERFLADGVVVDDVYAAVHRDNLLWAWDEV